MMYVNNLVVVFVGSVELRKVHTQEQNLNMDTHKLGVVEFLNTDEEACCDEDVMA